MELHNIKEFKRGWIIGDFTPSLIRTKEFEVAVQYYEKFKGEPKHLHKLADEVTVIISGEAKMNGMVYRAGDVLFIKAGSSTDFIPLTENVVTCVVKVPSIIGDKYVI